MINTSVRNWTEWIGIALAVAACATGTPRAAAQCSPQEMIKLIASDADSGDEFAYSLAMEGDTAVIGARLDDGGGANAGAAYVFVLQGGTWVEQQKLTASDAAVGDQFGYSVAISGDSIVVGAPFDDYSSIEPGSAYVFARSAGVWTEQMKLTPSLPANIMRFGWSVAIDGSRIVVGRPNLSGGRAYVFEGPGGVWSEQAILIGADTAASDSFGDAVAVSGDTILVGVPDHTHMGVSHGAAYVFVGSGAVWTQEDELIGSDTAAGDEFGVSVALDGDTALVGAGSHDLPMSNVGAAYVLERSGGVWSEQEKLTASTAGVSYSFGRSVAVDGDAAVVGACTTNCVGAAYMFLRDGADWSERAEMTAWSLPSDDPGNGDAFGHSVAVSGETALVGAVSDDHAGGLNAGSAYAFDLTPVTRAGDLDDDGDVDEDDTAILIDVLLGLDNDPLHLARADVDCSGTAAGLDVPAFVDVMLN